MNIYKYKHLLFLSPYIFRLLSNFYFRNSRLVYFLLTLGPFLMLSYCSCLPFTSVPYPLSFLPFIFAFLLFYSDRVISVGLIALSLASAGWFVPGHAAGSLCLQAEGHCQDSATLGWLGASPSPCCCFRAAAADWHQCPALLSFAGQGIQRKSFSYGHTVLALRKGIFHFLTKLCTEGLHPAQVRLLCVHPLSWNCCTLPHSCSHMDHGHSSGACSVCQAALRSLRGLELVGVPLLSPQSHPQCSHKG